MASSNIANIRIEPVDVQWEIEEATCVKTVADVAASLNNKYFFVYSGADVKYHVWFNVAAGGTDPAPVGSTEIEVAIASGATAAAVATAMQAAVDAETDFKATVSGDEVTIKAAVVGDTTSTTDFDTGFTFVQLQEGGSIDLGLLDGDVEVSFEETLLEVTAHQTGVTALADLRQGIVASVTLTLKESGLALQKEMLAKTAGGTYTPSGGDEVFGRGTNRQGLNTIIQARRLIMHPVALATSDYTRDLCFWKAYPMPESLTFSGENPESMAVTFKIYLDDSKPAAIKQFIRGNWNQTEFIP